ncbi:membrane protein [Cellulomonas hominis]|jgi:hypothetical protein|uniref:Membrane protein n=1 Tax=Cellulomonas hominis TaxID=156981 RepID=A0A511FCG0_9CELL|nr:DUF3105 domain-containing protein [Cellulomonas hominis]MBB5471807.1 hypothetical protein [Cellulomonas hominis]NKY08482.1 DUF3105 domain-containing protein [Cellulomonas hominis]GEL46893.1 membrane protein [Cellulomonas hominis]
MPDRRPTAAERQARLAAVRAEQRSKERRRTVTIASIAGVLVLALVGVSAWVILDAGRENAALEAQAEQAIDGVEQIDGLTFNHVTTAVDYAQDPPAGGDHNAAWLNCGVYTEPVPDENAVHSLEHGAVWITYDPALPADQVAALEALAAGQSYVIVSPYEGLDSAVAASAWGYQLKVDSADDERLAVFVQKYLLNPELAEVGAPCSNGVGVPA